MKVMTYARADQPRAGIIVDDTVYDVETCSTFLELEPLPSDLLTILARGQTDRLEDLYRGILGTRQSRGDLPLRCWAALEEVNLCPPLLRPGKIICLGRNYREHAEEQGAEIPERPLLFAKASTAVIAHGDPIVIPKGSVKVDYEGELAFIVGRRLKHAEEDEAAGAIFGYTCMNDVTEREAQRSEKQWFRSKSMDTFAPMGPWIVSADEVGDPLNLSITTKVNSRVMQSDSTSNLIFTPARILTFISSSITLEPGDIISTGTPGGVGVFRKPQVFLKDGDVVEITIQRIGTLSNPVAKAS